MTIASTTTRQSYLTDGVSTSYPVQMQAYAAADFTATLTASGSPAPSGTLLVLGSDYNMAPTGTLSPTEWTLTRIGSAWAPGQTLQVFLNPIQEQNTVYTQGQAFPSSAVQANVDRLTQMVLRLQDQVNRALIAPDTDPSPSIALPPAAIRASTYAAWDANGNYTSAKVLVPGTAISQSIIAGLLSPPSPIEIIKGVVITAGWYLYGDPRRYGALGNGVADDSIAFAYAASVCGVHQMDVYNTGNPYIIGTAFQLPANAVMRGHGRPTLQAVTAGQHIVSAVGVAGEIGIYEILFAGVVPSSTLPLANPSGYGANVTGLVTLANLQNARVIDCEFSTFYNGLSCINVQNLWIQRNKIAHWYFIGSNASNSGTFHIDENQYNTCDQTGAVVSYAISFSGNIEGGFTSSQNTIKGNKGTGIRSWFAIASHDYDGVEIAFNDFRDVRGGVNLGHLFCTNICQNAAVHDNYFEQTAVDTWSGANASMGAIELQGVGSVTVGGSQTWVGTGTIAGNTLTLNSTTGGVPAVGQTVVTAAQPNGVAPNTRILSGAGTVWQLSGPSQAVGPVAMLTLALVLNTTVSNNKARGFFNIANSNGTSADAVFASTHCADSTWTGNQAVECAYAGAVLPPQAAGYFHNGYQYRLRIQGGGIQGGSFVRGGVRIDSAVGDVYQIQGVDGWYQTTANPHILVNASSFQGNAVWANPTNSAIPYQELGASTVGLSTMQSSAGYSLSATALVTGGTIPTTRNEVAITLAGAATGVILQLGVAPNQRVTVYNRSAANSATMAASGTSNVADGVACVIAALTQKTFYWDFTSALWYHS